MHQDKEYYQDLYYNILLDWMTHHTPYGYMDRYRWLISMTKFSIICGSYPVKNQILLFYGHNSHFDDGALRQMMCKKIQPFVLKSGNSINDHPNDNGQNSKLKSLYNMAKITWLLKYGRKSFHLTTWTMYWLKHGTPSRCHLEISLGKSLQKIRYPPSSLPT